MLATYMAREVSRISLLFSEYSDRYIERITSCTHQTVGKIRQKLVQLGVKWEDIESLSDEEFHRLLYPKLSKRLSDKVMPDFEYISKELGKKGKRRKTRKILHNEYRLKYGHRAYKRSMFNQLIREHMAAHHVVMKQQYQPGEILFIDFTGTKLKYSEQGKTVYLNVFVACLGYSKKVFAYATKDMTSQSWISGLIKAAEYFGGVPDVVQFDNAKAMVLKPSRLAILNHNAIAFAQHYGCMCDTSRVATPTDNGNAENAAKIFTMNALVEMNSDLQFFSAKEVNAHLFQKVEEINATSFQKRPESRNVLFDSAEQTALKKLPLLPLKPFLVQKTLKVPSTYMLPYQGHEYSVPYTLVSKVVTVRITEDTLTVISNGNTVVQHTLKSTSGFTRLPEHMPPSHQAEERKSKDTFMTWAHDIGEDAEALIEAQYRQVSNSKSRAVGKRCTTLQKLCDTCGEELFSKACNYALARDFIDPDDIEIIIDARAWESSISTHVIEHENVRGKDYYEENAHE